MAKAANRVLGAEQASWTDRLEQDLDNVVRRWQLRSLVVSIQSYRSSWQWP